MNRATTIFKVLKIVGSEILSCEGVKVRVLGLLSLLAFAIVAGNLERRCLEAWVVLNLRRSLICV